MIKQAFVLGAGLGTRLRPLTAEMPKPLVPIFQKPLITFSLDHLRSVGIESFVINTHRLKEQFERAFASGKYRGVPLRLLHEPDLLETGGGIKNAETWLRSEPFIVYSGDILTDVDLQPLIDAHFRDGNQVTLALRNTGLATAVAFRDGRVIDISNRYGHPGTHDFANISIWNPDVFARIAPGAKTSFVPIVGEWIGQGGKIGAVVLNERRWFNIGSREGYLEVHRTVAEDGWRPAYLDGDKWPASVAPDAEVDRSAELSGWNSIGSGCRVGAGARLHNTILFPGAQIASRSDLSSCIVRAHRKAEGTLRDIDI
ncbi:NDP-sugar synthase [soil metagenome]